MVRIEVPDKAGRILDTLRGAGFEAFVVGGCVRDALLGRTPNDWDITTSALPLEVKALFPRTVDTGLKHGTVTVLMGGEGFEVTTYRVDGDYEDGRHPVGVTFTRNLAEDLQRRDFTVNAMAYNDSEGLVDLFGGRDDMENRLIRAVGDPQARFAEDSLRIMRAVRFAAQLGYDIEERTRHSLARLAPTLSRISAERIRVELEKTIVSDRPGLVRVMYETGITAQILPEFDRCMETAQNHPHHCYSVGEHILHGMEQVRADKVLRLTMLLHDISKPSCKTTDEDGIDHFYGHAEAGYKAADRILTRLKYDNETRHAVTTLVRYHDLPVQPTQAGVRRAIVKVGEDLFPLLLEVKQADMLAQSDFQREEKQRSLDEIRALYQEILEKKDCLNLKNLAVSGKDLLEAGMEPGVQIGRTLSAMLEEVLQDPSRNRREYLLEKYVKC